VLRETTSRGLCELVCPSRTSERGGQGDCVKEGGGEEGKCERERALERLALDIVVDPRVFITALCVFLTMEVCVDMVCVFVCVCVCLCLCVYYCST
jgi:hypothetical protein